MISILDHLLWNMSNHHTMSSNSKEKLGLDFCDFDNFLFFDLSLRCHEALSNLFPHLHELNLVAAALTHLKISKEHLYN